MIECKYCGEQIPDTANVCPYCCEPQTKATKVCQYCGEVIDSDAGHCPICGELLDGVAQQEATGQTAEQPKTISAATMPNKSHVKGTLTVAAGMITMCILGFTAAWLIYGQDITDEKDTTASIVADETYDSEQDKGIISSIKSFILDAIGKDESVKETDGEWDGEEMGADEHYVSLKGNGNLSGRYEITMEIICSSSGEVTGNYYYNRYGPDNYEELQGTLSGNELYLEEYDTKDGMTGTFSGIFDGTTYHGTWTSSINGKTRPFNITFYHP